METLNELHSLNDKLITRLEDHLLKEQTYISHLKSIQTKGDNDQHLQECLVTLESDFQKLKQTIHDEFRERLMPNAKYIAAINKLTDRYSFINNQIKSTQSSNRKNNKPRVERHLLADIVKEIKSKNFVAAESLILGLDDIQRIRLIVSDVYANSQVYLNLLLEFAEALANADLCCYVFNALWYEMRSNDHCNPYKMISLAKGLEKIILNKENISGYSMALAETKMKEIVDDIMEVVTYILKEAIYADNEEKNVDFLIQTLVEFRVDVADEVIIRTVSEAYPTISAANLAENIYNNPYISLRISGLTTLFCLMKSANDLNSKVILSIGNYLKDIIAQPDYESVTEEKKQSVQSSIEAIPICARNLIFAQTICLWNKAMKEYMYVAPSHFNLDKDRRRLFTWHSGKQLTQCFWYHEMNGVVIRFENAQQKNEYLCATSIGRLNKKKSNLFTWIAGGTVESMGNWIIELDGDYCYLKNEKNGEYLFASSQKYDQNRRFAATAVRGTSIKQPEFQWQIRSANRHCSMHPITVKQDVN